MPYAFNIFATLNLIVLRPQGVLSDADMTAYFKELRAHPDFRFGYNRLIDNEALEDVDLTYAQMRNIQRFEDFSPHLGNRPIRTAFVTPNDAGYGMARMYQSVASGQDLQQVELFDTRDAALGFLDIPPHVYAATCADAALRR